MCTNKSNWFCAIYQNCTVHSETNIPVEKLDFRSFSLSDQNGVSSCWINRHSFCLRICSTQENEVLLVDAIDWEYTYKDLIKKVVCDNFRKVLLWKRSWMMSSVIWKWTLSSIIVSDKQQIVLHWLHLQRHT